RLGAARPAQRDGPVAIARDGLAARLRSGGIDGAPCIDGVPDDGVVGLAGLDLADRVRDHGSLDPAASFPDHDGLEGLAVEDVDPTAGELVDPVVRGLDRCDVLAV